jgi:hypothetical protein
MDNRIINNTHLSHAYMIGFLILMVSSVYPFYYGVTSVQAQYSTTSNSATNPLQNGNNSDFTFDKAYTLPLNVNNNNNNNNTALAPIIGQPTLLKQVPTASLQASEPYLGGPREIREPGTRNATEKEVQQSEAQSMSNTTLNEQVGKKNVLTFNNASNSSSSTTSTLSPLAAQSSNTTRNVSAPLLASQITGFKGLDMRESGGYFPPDAALGVGPNHVMEMVNIQGAIWNKQGDPLSVFGLDQFFATGTDSITDPRVFYDPGSQRWFASLQDISTNSIHVAVSTTEDPTGDWYIYDFPFSNCPDQPSIGVSKDKFVVSVNTFANLCNGGFTGAQFTVVHKDDLLSGTNPPRFVQSDPDPLVFSLHTTETQDPLSTTAIDMVSVDSGGSDYVMLASLDGQVPNINATANFLSINTTNVPPKAIQPDTIKRLETNDARVLDAEGHQGTVWFTFNDGCIPNGDTQIRSCVRLIQLDAINKTVLQDFNVAVNRSYLFIPALSVDNAGNLDVVYGLSSRNDYPSLVVSERLVSDPPNTLETPVLLQPGTGPDFSGRYGDYFAVAVDPSDPNLFWVAGQYIPQSQDIYWSTFIGHFRTK